MTDMTIGSVWQTDVCGKWPVPSLQGNHYSVGFLERASRKIFIYFSKSKELLPYVKDLVEAEIPKLRVRHGLKDFIIHSDVGEFQTDRIRALVRAHGGEIQKGTAYTPESQCFIERAWRTIMEMASTMIIAAGLSEPNRECAQQYAVLIYNRTVVARATRSIDTLIVATYLVTASATLGLGWWPLRSVLCCLKGVLLLVVYSSLECLSSRGLVYLVVS